MAVGRVARGRRNAAMLVAVGLVAGAAMVAVIPAADRAAAVIGECPDGTIPGPGNTNPVWTDQNVAIYAGGDFQVRQSAAEAEGVVVIAGDASFDKTPGGRFNVGWVGVGSAVVPAPGSTMLAVGGDLGVGAMTVLDVGANAFDGGQLLGGDVQIGGQSVPDYEQTGQRYELNNGTLTQGMGAAAIAPWSSWGTQIADESADFAALAPTGTVTAGALLTFSGDGTAVTQVFEVSAATLAANPAIGFTDVPDGAAVIINVVGGPVTWAPNYFAEDGVRADDPASPLFGLVAARTLWNFTDATSVHIAGSSQVLGTILVPSANPDASQPTLRVTASTNGRLYTNGTILMDGVGNEHHNYPWVDAPFECIPVIPPIESGSITVSKVLPPDQAALLPPGTTFHGLVSCPVDDGGELIVEWEVAPGETTTVESLPVGAECEITETIGLSHRARLLLPGVSFDATALAAWQAPTWTLNGDPVTAPVDFVVPAPSDETQLAFVVTNELAVGAFTIEKIVENADEVAFDDGFAGTWECAATQGGDDVLDEGTWTLTAGETSDPIEAPVGAWCTVAETPPGAPEGGSWSPVVIAPAELQITQESEQTPIAVTVTNTLTPLMGAFTIGKVVDNPDEVAFADGFTGAWSCSTAPDGSGIIDSGTWALQAGEVSAPIEARVGAWCTVSEAAQTDPDGGEWATPVIEPDPVQITEDSAATPIAITVTNTLTRILGAFTITKSVSGKDAPLLTFEGSWSCTLGGAVVAEGTWSLSAAETSDPISAAVGATCTVAEATPIGGEGTWATPAISPAAVVITAGSALAPLSFTVANVFTPRAVSPDSPDLPTTGGTVAWEAIALGGALLIGGAALVCGRALRRRRA